MASDTFISDRTCTSWRILFETFW